MTIIIASSMFPLRVAGHRRLDRLILRPSSAHSCSVQTRSNPFPRTEPSKADATGPAPPNQSTRQSTRSPSTQTFKSNLIEQITRPQTRTSPLLTPSSQGARTGTSNVVAWAEAADSRSRSQTARQQGGIFQGGSIFQGMGLDVSDLANKRATNLPTLAAPLRLDAFIGRSEPVPIRGAGLIQAIRRLDIKLAYNKVKSDQLKQRFHERPGLKRKRLSSERWRIRFKEGFKATIAKVQNMKSQGW